MERLLKSAKFWTLALDLVVSVTLHFVGKYAAPVAYDDVQFLIVTLQPAFAMVIGSIAYEDGIKAKYQPAPKPE